MRKRSSSNAKSRKSYIVHTGSTRRGGIYTHKVYPDGADVAVRESVVRETQQKARLAHAGIADQHQLEEVITAVTKDTTTTQRERERASIDDQYSIFLRKDMIGITPL